MKYKLFISTFLIAQLVIAQQLISFESDEGYSTGDINGQDNWQTSSSGPNFVMNQVITAANATDGSNSLNLVKESDFGVLVNPQMGAYYIFNEAVEVSSSLIVSLDFLIDLQGESEYLFALGDSSPQTNDNITGFILKPSGEIFVLSNSSSDGSGSEVEINTGAIWSTGDWVNMRVEIAGNQQEVFLNDASIYSGVTSNQNTDLESISLLHTNANSTAFIDNIRINNETLSLNDLSANLENIKVKYAVSDKSIHIQNISLNNDLSIKLYSITGQEVFSSPVIASNSPVLIQNLNDGIYIVKLVKKNLGVINNTKILKY